MEELRGWLYTNVHIEISLEDWQILYSYTGKTN